MTVSLTLVLALASLLAAPARAQGWSWPDGQSRQSSSSSSSSSSKAAPASAASDTPVVTSRRYADSPFNGGRPRYEIVDPDSDDFTLPHPEDLAPGRPRPPQSFGAPGPGGPGYRPPRPLPPPSGNLGPVGGPGPINRPPPGVDRFDPSDVSKCKCVHAFNCEGNALSFGSCDVGKRYCCTKEPRALGPRPGGFGAAGPIGGPGGRPAILTGPGGPTGPAGFKDDRFDRYDRYPSAYDRYPDRNPGVLVGPRPTPYRPDPAAGFAPGPVGFGGSRPGGFYNNYNGVRGPSNSPYRDYDNYNNRGFGLNRP